MLSFEVQVVGVTEREVLKEGRQLRFYRLNYVDNGRVGTLGLPDQFVGRVRSLVGQRVTLRLDMEEDRRFPWLYRLEVVDVEPVSAVASGAK
jgi:hypothetical protein